MSDSQARLVTSSSAGSAIRRLHRGGNFNLGSMAGAYRLFRTCRFVPGPCQFIKEAQDHSQAPDQDGGLSSWRW